MYEIQKSIEIHRKKDLLREKAEAKETALQFQDEEQVQQLQHQEQIQLQRNRFSISVAASTAFG
jgi:hypothetical protein